MALRWNLEASIGFSLGVTNIVVANGCEFGVKILTSFTMGATFHELCSEKFLAGSRALSFDRLSLPSHCMTESFWVPCEMSQRAIWPGLSFVPKPVGGILALLLINLEVSSDSRSCS